MAWESRDFFFSISLRLLDLLGQMGKTGFALLFAAQVDLLQQTGKFCLFLGGERFGKPFVTDRFNPGFGIFQRLCLFSGKDLLAAPVCGIFLPVQVSLFLQIGGLPATAPLSVPRMRQISAWVMPGFLRTAWITSNSEAPIPSAFSVRTVNLLTSRAILVILRRVRSIFHSSSQK